MRAAVSGCSFRWRPPHPAASHPSLRPTRAGWSFFAITLGVGFAALNTGNNLLYLVLSLMLAFLVLSGFLSESALRGLEIERVLPRDLHSQIWFYVLVLAIGLSFWVQYARTVRGSVMVERNKEYVQAARVIDLPHWLIMVRHILPNVMRPVLVLATIGLALAIIAEATLSFLGQGIPPTTPSLGTLIRVGNQYLFSGLWWITFFPAIALVILVFAVNLRGDWMRDALNPKLS